MLIKEMEDDTKRWKGIPCSWMKNQFCQTILPMAIYTFKAITIKLSMVIFIEIEQKISQSLERITELKESGSRLQTILQSYSNKNSMVLAQKWK